MRCSCDLLNQQRPAKATIAGSCTTTVCDREGTEFTKSECVTFLGGTVAQAKIGTTTLPTYLTDLI